MSRPVRNELHIEPTSDGGWRLFGYFRGARVRRKDADYSTLEAEKLRMEGQLAAIAAAEAKQPRLRMTWLDEDQFRDAEASVLMSRGRRLSDCVVAADRVLPPVRGIKCTDALDDWVATLKKRKRSWRTEAKNVGRVKAFIAFAAVEIIEEIRPRMIEDWVYRETRADGTRITDAQVVCAWLNHCRKRKWLVASPFEIDMADLKATARPVEDARILSPAQAHALLAAAREIDDGLLVPYVILSTWCFISPQEIVRTTRDKMKLDAASPVVEVDTVKRRTEWPSTKIRTAIVARSSESQAARCAAPRMNWTGLRIRRWPPVRGARAPPSRSADPCPRSAG